MKIHLTASAGLYAQPAMLTGLKGLPHRLKASTIEGVNPLVSQIWFNSQRVLPPHRKILFDQDNDNETL